MNRIAHRHLRNTNFSSWRGRAKALVPCLLLVAWGGMTLLGQTIVVPNQLAETDGGRSGQTPDGNSGGIRGMIVADSAQFNVLTGPAYLTGFAYRPNGVPGPSGPRSARLKISASTTRTGLSALSTTFAENLGADTALVFDGELTWHSANLPAAGNTRQFDILFPLTTPFLYDPAGGNLVLDIQILEGRGSSYSWDSNDQSPAVRYISSTASATAVRGQFSTPPVVQFTFEPAPVVSIRVSQVQVCWSSVPNASYRVEWQTDASSTTWTPLVECVGSDGAATCITDSVSQDALPKLYRVIRTDCLAQ